MHYLRTACHVHACTHLYIHAQCQGLGLAPALLQQGAHISEPSPVWGQCLSHYTHDSDNSIWKIQRMEVLFPLNHPITPGSSTYFRRAQTVLERENHTINFSFEKNQSGSVWIRSDTVTRVSPAKPEKGRPPALAGPIFPVAEIETI